MTNQELQAIRERLPEYVCRITERSRGAFWVCPLCGSGTGPNRSGAFRVHGTHWKCFSCGCGGDVFDLIGEFEQISGFQRRARRAKEVLNIEGNMNPITTSPVVRRDPKSELEPSFIPVGVMQASFTAYDRNNFASWLVRVFGKSRALQLALAYQIGTSKHWPGGCVFWQIDDAGRIRRGKVMLYNAETGRRVKEPGNMVAGVHWLLGMPDRKPDACLFGLHLAASDRSKPIAVVESEKSAIIGAGFVPEFIWMASGGISTLNREMLRPLQGRRIMLYPDLGAFDKWSDKAAGWQGVEISDTLERRASTEDRTAGLDVADYLLKEHFSTFN